MSKEKDKETATIWKSEKNEICDQNVYCKDPWSHAPFYDWLIDWY